MIETLNTEKEINLFDKPTCANFRNLLKELKQPIIIGVAGDSGSGKTTYTSGIEKLIGKDLVSTIAMDGYHKEDRDERSLSGILPLDPNANHLDLLAHHLNQLKEGKTAYIPIYNHDTGKFNAPIALKPTPIIIIEGLHALYPEFLPYLDFSIYVDPEDSLKWEWKYERDVNQRGHSPEALEQEMLKRAAAYKRWLEFQETNANVVIKLYHSQLLNLTHPQYTGTLPIGCLKVELIIEPSASPLPSLPLPFNLGAILTNNHRPFLLSVVPGIFWGRKVMRIQIEGVFSEETTANLEEQIINFTGISLDEAISRLEQTYVCSNELSQLLVIWRFLEQVNFKIQNSGVRSQE
jgi:phosphoribulokinase